MKICTRPNKANRLEISASAATFRYIIEPSLEGTSKRIANDGGFRLGDCRPAKHRKLFSQHLGFTDNDRAQITAHRGFLCCRWAALSLYGRIFFWLFLFDYPN